MNVVIIGSLSCIGMIEEIEKFFVDQFGFECVTAPSDTQVGSLVKIQQRYIEKIAAADLVVVCPKDFRRVTVEDVDKEAYEEILYMGESTSYEIALAKQFNKPVVYWTPWV